MHNHFSEDNGTTLIGSRILAFFLLFITLKYFSDSEPFVPFLDHVNLAFHEAGHLLLGSIGPRFWHFFTGTLGQLIMPAIFMVHFYREGQRTGKYACLWWIGQNLLNISVYAGDAVAQRLPLVGGGQHDWAYMLRHLGLLKHTSGVSRLIFTLGILIIVYSLFQLMYISAWKRDKRT